MNPKVLPFLLAVVAASPAIPFTVVKRQIDENPFVIPDSIMSSGDQDAMEQWVDAMASMAQDPTWKSIESEVSNPSASLDGNQVASLQTALESVYYQYHSTLPFFSSIPLQSFSFAPADPSAAASVTGGASNTITAASSGGSSGSDAGMNQLLSGLTDSEFISLASHAQSLAGEAESGKVSVTASATSAANSAAASGSASGSAAGSSRATSAAGSSSAPASASSAANSASAPASSSASSGANVLTYMGLLPALPALAILL